MANLIEIITEEIQNIFETGEGNVTAYQYRRQNVAFNQIDYYFETEDGDEYFAYFINTDRNHDYWEVGFAVQGYEYMEIVNKGRIFNIMATMLKIVDDFIEKEKPNVLVFEPAKTTGEDDKRRERIYMQYVIKNIKNRPEYVSEIRGDKVIIQRIIKKKKAG